MGDSVPEWITSALIEEHLQIFYKNRDLRVLSIDVKLGVGKNENFSSFIYRAIVKFKDIELKEKSILIKVPLPPQPDGSMLNNLLFEKEGEFYSQICPKIKSLLNKLNEKQKLLPEIIGICENKAILMEDLAVDGYVVKSKFHGLNLSDTKKILQKAAALHATGTILQQEQPKIFENFRHGCVNRIETFNNAFYLSNFDAICDLITSLPEFAYLSEKLSKLRNKFIEKTYETLDPDPTQFNTLVHGDLWINNLLLQYDDDTLAENTPLKNIMFIDFQYSCWTSPAIDLHYFFNSSLQEDVRSNHIDELVEFYHRELTTRLEKLNYQKHIPTLQQFQQEFLSKSFFGFFSSCVLQPMILNEHVEIDYATSFLGNKDTKAFKRRIFGTPRVKEYVQRLVPIYDQLGVFD